MAAHQWHFFRAGGVDQVSLQSAEDLASLDQLDPKLWVALAMPIKGVDLDKITLDLVDTDHDGRIRIDEILETARWLEGTFKKPEDVLKTATKISLASLADPKIVAAAKRMLSDLGKATATEISVEDVAAIAKALIDTKLNGDGIVTVDSTDDLDLKHAITDTIASITGAVDRSGKPGVDAVRVEEMFVEVDKRRAWLLAGKAAAVHGDATAAMADALAAVRAKLDDFFTRCRFAAFDARGAVAMSGQDADLIALGARALSSGDSELGKLTLARVDPSGRLPLDALNPAWVAPMKTFVDAAVTPILGARDVLTADDVAKVIDVLAPFDAWRAAKPTTKVDALEVPWLDQLAADDLRSRLRSLIAADLALADDYTNSASVSRAVYLQRDFGRLLRNFVNFSDFYSHQDGMFQAGTLYLDARALHLCVVVTDPGKHAVLAAASDCYLVYCDLVRGAEKMQIVGALSNGDEDNIFVGRNGVFYDRAGKDWDATVSKVVGNPISIRQAFFSPYKKAVRAVEDMINKRAQAASDESQKTLSTTATELAVDEAPAADGSLPPPPPPAAAAAPAPAPVTTTLSKKIDLGTVAAIGVAVGGIGTLVGALLSAVFGLGPWLPFGFVALLMLISGPSMLLAWLKLRRRNLGPILDANGWAINGRAKINVTFGAAMTELAKLPPGAQSSVDDPFSDKKTPWRRWVVLIVILVIAGLWFFGRIDRYLPIQARSTSVLGTHAPAYDEAKEKAITAGATAAGTAAGNAAPVAAGSAAAAPAAAGSAAAAPAAAAAAAAGSAAAK